MAPKVHRSDDLDGSVATQTIGGNTMQGEMTIDQMFSLRSVPGYADYRTPVQDLFLCGSGTHPGGGVMAVPGRNAAQAILKDGRIRRLTRRAPARR